MPPLMRGKCGVPSSELTTQRLPPQSVPRTSRPSKPASVRKPTASSSPRHRLEEAALGDVVDAALAPSLAAEVVAGERPGPGDAAAGMREQAELQRRSCRSCRPSACRLDARRDALPVDPVEQPRQPVAAAAGQRDARGARAATRWIAASRVSSSPAKRCVLGAARRRRSSTVEAERGQALRGAAQRRGRAQHAGRREQAAATIAACAHDSVRLGVDLAATRRPESAGAARRIGVDQHRRRGPALPVLLAPLGEERRAAPRRASAASTPPTTSVWWLSGGLPNTSITDPAAPAFGIGGAEHDPLDAGVQQRHRAHRAGLERHVELALRQPVVARAAAPHGAGRRSRRARSGRGR